MKIYTITEQNDPDFYFKYCLIIDLYHFLIKDSDIKTYVGFDDLKKLIEDLNEPDIRIKSDDSIEFGSLHAEYRFLSEVDQKLEPKFFTFGQKYDFLIKSVNLYNSGNYKCLSFTTDISFLYTHIGNISELFDEFNKTQEFIRDYCNYCSNNIIKIFLKLRFGL